MSKITIKKVSSSNVDIPAVGEVTLFFDVVGDIMSMKLDDGSVLPIGDKTFEQDVASTTSAVMNHNLNKIPSVICIEDGSGLLVAATNIIYDTGNLYSSLTVYFDNPFTGKIICN